MPRAFWNGQLIAESDETVIVEGNHYFPASSLRSEFCQPSTTTTTCPWKGVAHYYTLVIDGKQNKDAVWYYPNPLPAANDVAGRVAFWKGVRVEA